MFAAIVHLVPWLIGIGGLAGLFGEPETTAALITIGVIVLTRLFLYSVLGFDLVAAALLHPLEIVITLYIFARSTLVVGILRNVTWRGRGYPSRITTFGEFD